MRGLGLEIGVQNLWNRDWAGGFMDSGLGLSVEVWVQDVGCKVSG